MATATKAKTAPKKKASVETESLDGELDHGMEGDVSTKTAKPKAARKPAKVKAPPRAKLYWGVFNQNLKRVAVFEFEKKKDAEKHAKELSKSGAEHFLQRIKEVIE